MARKMRWCMTRKAKIWVWKAFAALELSLLIVEGIIGESNEFLPVCGSHIGQIGAIFGTAFVITEVFPECEESELVVLESDSK